MSFYDAIIIGSGASRLTVTVALAHAGKGSSPLVLQAEEPSLWPEYLRRKMEREAVAREEEEMEV